MTDNTSKYGAGPALAGYLFQCRLALLIGLRFIKTNPNGTISIEKFDDISFENDNVAECLIQAKHHSKPKSLEDKSVDVWKTLQIWIDALRENPSQIKGTRLIIITTANAPDGSAMAKLRSGTKPEDRVAAGEILSEAARTSNNKTTQAARDAFLSLKPAELQLLLGQIEILDYNSNLADMTAEIEGELRLLSSDQVSSVAEQLEGWWLQRVAKCLVEEGWSSISLQDIIRQAGQIASFHRDDKLPIHTPDQLGAREYETEDELLNFVRQMRLILMPDRPVRRAVADYYRAYTQRSRWARENLLLDGEAERYDEKLKDRFERYYDTECISEPTSSDDQKKEIGRRACLWASRDQVEFRNVLEAWMTSGSYHGLADRLEIGWHPDYRQALAEKKEFEDA